MYLVIVIIIAISRAQYSVPYLCVRLLLCTYLVCCSLEGEWSVSLSAETDHSWVWASLLKLTTLKAQIVLSKTTIHPDFKMSTLPTNKHMFYYLNIYIYHTYIVILNNRVLNR